MNTAERNACKCLLKDRVAAEEEPDEDPSDEDSDSDLEKAYENDRKRQFEEVAGESKYVNCDFILGSAAIVEALWSEADALLIKRRRSMAPITIELILFLKKNEDLWTLNDVNLANEDRKGKNRSVRLAERMNEADLHEGLVGDIVGDMGLLGL